MSKADNAQKVRKTESQDTDVSSFSLGRWACLQCRGWYFVSYIPSSTLWCTSSGNWRWWQSDGRIHHEPLSKGAPDQQRTAWRQLLLNSGWEAKPLDWEAESHGLPRVMVSGMVMWTDPSWVAARTQELSYKFAYRSDYFAAFVHGGGKQLDWRPKWISRLWVFKWGCTSMGKACVWGLGRRYVCKHICKIAQCLRICGEHASLWFVRTSRKGVNTN